MRRANLSREVARGLDGGGGRSAAEKEVEWGERAGAMRVSHLPGVKRVDTYLSCCTLVDGMRASKRRISLFQKGVGDAFCCRETKNCRACSCGALQAGCSVLFFYSPKDGLP